MQIMPIKKSYKQQIQNRRTVSKRTTQLYNIKPKPAKTPAAMTATPYVFPRFKAAMAADLVDEVEEAVVVASPKLPKPVVVAAVAEEPEEPDEVEVAEIEDVLATPGF